MINPEEGVDSYYHRHWPKFIQWWDGTEAQALHVGLYEKGVHSHVEALNHMNDYVAQHLHLDDNKSMKILDAGCGVGGPATYLAQKYPASSFTGITITRSQVGLAKKLAQERNVTVNTDFMFQNFRSTAFPDNYFDGVYTVESIAYAKSKEEYIREMYRILKPGGRIAIVDAFLRDKPLTSLTQNVYDFWGPAKGYPDLCSVHDFTLWLRATGFANIDSEDLTMAASRSIARASIIGFPYFWASLIKRVLQRGHYQPEEDINYFMGAVILEVTLGLTKILRLCSVAAEKK